MRGSDELDITVSFITITASTYGTVEAFGTESPTTDHKKEQ